MTNILLAVIHLADLNLPGQNGLGLRQMVGDCGYVSTPADDCFLAEHCIVIHTE